MLKWVSNFRNKVQGFVERYAGEGLYQGPVGDVKNVEVSRASVLLLWVVAGCFLLLFVWISVAEVDTVTRGDGRVVPSAKLQVIQNLEGGIVSEIFVKPGEQVSKGDRLVVLSGVQHDSELKIRSQQVWAMEAKVARLAALADGHEPHFPPIDDEAIRALVLAEKAAFQIKRSEQSAQLAVVQSQLFQKQRERDENRINMNTAQKGLELAIEERKTVAMLVEKGLEPKLELVKLDRNITDLQGRAEVAVVALSRIEAAINEIESRKLAMTKQFRSEALAELNRTQADLNSLKESVPALEDRLARAEIRSPMSGVVNRIFVSTVGGVVKPGEPIVEVVPADDELVVEALVRPQDIGFVKLGQQARVKISAYDYSIFGGVDGKVVNVSADAVPNEKGEAFYMVRIETDKKAIEVLDKKLPIIPGMQCQVDVITGKKTVLQFLSKPIVAVRENAFRER